MINLKKIKEFSKKDISLFLYANILYTLSTGLINLLSPLILEKDAYEEFIYVFQNIMYLTSVCTAGLVPTLLRFYKYDSTKYQFYYTITTGFVFIILLILGLIPSNPLTSALNLPQMSTLDNFCIYFSTICLLLYIFNRGILTAQNKYKQLTLNICIIFFLRLAILFLIYYLDIRNLSLLLFLICILPFINELAFYVKNIFKINAIRLIEYLKFITFALKISAVGIIFMSTNRLFVISAKGYDDTLAATLSFATGLIGIIHILNTTISSYFIGKLDARNNDSIRNYLKRIKHFSLPFIILTTLTGTSTFFFVLWMYPVNPLQAAIFSTLTIIQAAIVFYIGLITLLTKTYNMLNIQLLVNIACFFTVLSIVQFCSKINSILEFSIINIIIITAELMLALIVIRKVNTETKSLYIRKQNKQSKF